MNSTRRALAFSFASRYLSMVVQFAASMMLARLLTPHEIGIYSITAAFFGITQIVREFGVGNYIIQEKELTTEKKQSAFCLALILCTCLAIIVVLIAPWLAVFYKQPAVEELLYLLSINLLIIPFGSITLAMLRRSMQFDKIMYIEFTSALVHSLTGVTAAYFDFSYYSLAMASLAGSITSVLGTLIYRDKSLPWKPGIGKLKEIYSFGWKMSVSNVFTHLNTTSADIILGKTLGPEPLAFFNRAISTVQLFSQLISKSITPVVQVYFAQLKRSDEKPKEPFLRATAYNLMLAWPFFAFLSINADLVIPTLFGHQWGRAIALVPIFCWNYSFNALTSFFEVYLTGSGQAALLLRLSFFILVGKVLILVSLSMFSLEQVVMGLVSVPLIRLLLIKRYLENRVGISIKDYPKIVWRPFVTSVVIMVVCLLVRHLTTSMSIYFALMLVSITTGLVWISFVFLLRHPFRNEIQMILTKVKNKIT